LIHDPEGRLKRGEAKASIYDIAPTILALMGFDAKGEAKMKGKALTGVS
jgi:predicted AlkP superfamily phosphohydrolase/phosphomutase